MEVLIDLFGFAVVSRANQNQKAALVYFETRATSVRDTIDEILENYRTSREAAIAYCQKLDPELQDAIICGRSLVKK
jgi:hypothetical protein